MTALGLIKQNFVPGKGSDVTRSVKNVTNEFATSEKKKEVKNIIFFKEVPL